MRTPLTRWVIELPAPPLQRPTTTYGDSAAAESEVSYRRLMKRNVFWLNVTRCSVRVENQQPGAEMSGWIWLLQIIRDSLGRLELIKHILRVGVLCPDR